MGGGCSSSYDEINQQEKYVRRNFNKYNNQFGSKYSREQIECKIRNVYHSNIKRGNFIPEKDWARVKNK